MDKKLRVLWWSDMVSATGFSQVAQNIVKRLDATGKYDFDIVAINYGGDPLDRKEYPYTIYPAIVPLSNDPFYRDVYGRGRATFLAGSGLYDILFILNDTFILQTVLPRILEARAKLPKERQFPIIFYTPIDGAPKKSWITDVVEKVEFPVTYTKYALNEMQKHVPGLDIPYIYHGVDRNDFFPLPDDERKEFRKKFFGEHADKYIVLNVSRNQPRKDLIRTLQAFKVFHDKNPDSFLFLLCQAQDVGGDVIEMGESIGLVWDKDFATPSPGTYNANQGYTTPTVNKIYNACDLVVSSSLGEGWGLLTSESFATKKPILVPKNTAFVEIIGENEERGYFCESGADPDHFVCLGQGDNNIVRPIVNVMDMADKMDYIYKHQDEAKAKAERAFKEVWTWDVVCKDWQKVFDSAEKMLPYLRGQAKYERNELCFCGSEKKYKHCHGK